MEEITEVDGVEGEIPEIWNILDLAVCDKYECPDCDNKLAFHPRYLEAKVAGCSKCEKIESIAKRMLTYRNYEFISIEKVGNRIIINFKCTKGHIHKKEWAALRKGHGCNICKQTKKQKKKVEKTIVPDCDCKNFNKGKYFGHTYVCEHYNFAILCPEAMKNWCFDLNTDIDPYGLPPGSSVKAHFRCEKYNRTYEQTLRVIYRGCGCPYCSGRSVCLENSLYTTHPEIAKTWHPCNKIKPWEVTSGSGEILWWLCDNGNSEHLYERQVVNQTERNGRCPCCSDGYAQKTGGHDEFLRVAREVHGDKYEYPDNYVKAHVPININCKVISPNTGLIHGLFSQQPAYHKAGQGCPKCAEEMKLSKGAIMINKILIKWGFIQDVHYFLEHKLEGLIYVNQLKLDFYIKENMCGNIYPIVIEYDHKQHFGTYSYWEDCLKTQMRDLRKDLFCVQNKIHLIRIPYTDHITDEYLATLIKKCRTEKVCYFSYKHYENEIGKIEDFQNMLVETVTLPSKYKNIQCSFDD